MECRQAVAYRKSEYTTLSTQQRKNSQYPYNIPRPGILEPRATQSMNTHRQIYLHIDACSGDEVPVASTAVACILKPLLPSRYAFTSNPSRWRWYRTGDAAPFALSLGEELRFAYLATDLTLR